MSVDPNLQLVAEAKTCKYTLIPKTFTCNEVLQIWLGVSQFVTRRLVQQKAVTIPGLGSFSVLKKKIDVGINGKLCVQRPVFILSEKFSQLHGIGYTKYQCVGDIPVVPLNYAALATDLELERDTVEMCVKELIGAFSRAVNTNKRGELTFREVGKLVVKDGKAKMKFCKEFLKLMDGDSIFSLHPISLGRPRTSESFISRNSVMSSRNSAGPSGFVLPKIKTGEPERPASVVSNKEGPLTLSPLPVPNEHQIQVNYTDF